jgi:hypothetical protein
VIVGAKFWLIGVAGSVVPFWDQWDAEAAFLYEPYLAGTLGVGHLLAAHNEHRILFTRLLVLLQLEVLAYWDPVGQMIVNAIIYASVIAMILVFYVASCRRGEESP